MIATEQELSQLVEEYKAADDTGKAAVESRMLEATEGLAEHPGWYDWPCACKSCMSYCD